MKEKVVRFLWSLLKVGSQEVKGKDQRLQRSEAKRGKPLPKVKFLLCSK